MLDVIIKYNPYKVVSTITVNGEEPKQNSKLNQFLNQRFQLWVDQAPSLLAEEYNDNEFDLTFFGTELDYQDLLAAIKIAEKSNIHFKAKKMPAKEFGDKELKDFILSESKELMNVKDYTIATYPFIQDSLYGQTAYMKRFREYLESSLTEK